MVCVTVQKTCERLIQQGAKLAGDETLSVVHVVKPGQTVLGGSSESEALEYLYRASRTYGAEMEMLRSDDVIGTIVGVARDVGAEYLVVGAAKGRSRLEMDRRLGEQLPDVKIIVIP